MWLRVSFRLPQRRFSSARGKARIRNIGVIAHVDAGKTTTTERMLFYSKKIRAMGDIDDGDTTMDFLPQEQERGITIQSACTTFDWNKHRINLVDTPGHVDFTVEVERSMRVLDGAVAVIDAVKGVEPQTQTVWRQADRHSVPRLIFINKMDREGASVEGALQSIRDRLTNESSERSARAGEDKDLVPLLVQLPLGAEHNFVGVVDLVEQVQWTWDAKADPTGRTFECVSVDNDSKCIEARQTLIEQLAEVDDGFAEVYLESEEGGPPVTASEMRGALRRSTLSGRAVPVLCGTSLKNKGVQPLLDAVCSYLPAPTDRPPVQAALLQGGRSPKDKKGQLDSTVLRKAEDKEPLCALAFKITHDPQRGPLVFVRVYSGVIRERDVLTRISADGKTAEAKKERVSKVLELNADDADEVAAVTAGNVACLVGLKDTCTGDTLIGAKDKQVVQLAGIRVPAPVFFCSAEVAAQSQQKQFEDALAIAVKDDPSLQVSVDTETGQTLLKGMGELHLDVTRQRLQTEHKVFIELGKMRVSYMETVNTESTHEHEFSGLVAGKDSFARISFRLEPNEREDGNVVAVAEELRESNEDVLLAAQSGFTEALTSGPLLGYPVTNVKITLLEIEDGADLNPTAYQVCASRGLAQCMRQQRGQVVLMQPMMRAVVSTSSESLADTVSDLVSRRRATVLEVITESQYQSSVCVEVPLSQMVGYSSALRSRTAGAGTFTMEYLSHSAMNMADQLKVLESPY